MFLKNSSVAIPTHKGPFTALHWVCWHGNVDLLRIMWDYSDPDARQEIFMATTENGWIVAHVAVTYNNVDCLVFLADHLGNRILETVDVDGSCPAKRAAGYGHVESFEYIIRNAPSGLAQLQWKNKSSDSMLSAALKSNSRFLQTEYFSSILEKVLQFAGTVLPPISCSCSGGLSTCMP